MRRYHENGCILVCDISLTRMRSLSSATLAMTSVSLLEAPCIDRSKLAAYRVRIKSSDRLPGVAHEGAHFGPPGFHARPDRRPRLRRLSRTSRTRGLHRHLRARPSDRGRARVPPRRHRTRAGAERPVVPAIPAAISFPLTTGRTASARRKAGRSGSTTPGAPRRPTRSASTSSPLVRGGGHRADAGGQSRLT